MSKQDMEKVGGMNYKGTVVFDTCEVTDIERMEVREDDTWVLSFPRSGTTLTQELVYMLKTNLDFETARQEPLDGRFPFLDSYVPNMPYFRGLRHIESMTSPRLIKSHLHHHVLPPQLFNSKCKKVYVMRNPKDVAVSCYMLQSFLKQSDYTDINEFMDDWLDDKTYASPWWRHVHDFWQNRHDPTLLILRYEDIVQEMPRTIKKIADHLCVQVTSEDIIKIAQHCNFDNMKNNSSTNAGWMSEARSMDDNFGGHIRRGKIGGWRDYLTEEISKKIDEIVLDKLGHTDIQFNYG